MDYYEYCCTEQMTMKGYYGWEGVHYTLDSKGSRVMTDLGKTQIGTGVQQPLPMFANTWAKVVCVTAPKDYNDAKLKRVQVYLEQGNIDPFECFASDSWTNAWPKVESEYQENFVKTVAGQMSVADFRAYLAKLREMPEFKQAFQDFAKMNKDIFGK
jgi:putative aldouronate transport system substrate-binding protein